MTVEAAPRRVAHIGDSLALAVLVVLALAFIRAAATGQAGTWLRAKFLNQAPGEPSAAGSGGFTTGSATATGALQDPVSGFGTVVAPGGCFGVDRPGHTHAGLDINVPMYWPVAAPAAGTVTTAGMGSTACGLALGIDHGGGLATYYCHLSRLAVARGNRVYRGQIVAYTGGRPGTYGAGNSAAPHLHFEVHRNGIAVDPAPLIGRTCQA